MTRYHERAEVPTVHRERLLIAFIEPTEAKQLLEQSAQVRQRIGSEARIDEVTEDEFTDRYRRARESLEEPTVRLDDPEIEPLPRDGKVGEHLGTVTQSPLFRRVFGEDDQLRIGRVPIDRLIPTQRAIRTGDAQRPIPGWESDPVGLLRVTIPATATSQPVSKMVQNTDNSLVGVQMTSRDHSVQVHSVDVKSPDDRVGTFVTFQLVPRPDFVQIARFGDRYLIKDGHHRILQLLQADEQFVPGVIVDVDSYDQVVDTASSCFPPSTVLADRPPLLTDFVSDAAVDVLATGSNQLLRILAETTEVPR